MIRERLMKILVSPHVSEKGTTVADKFRQVVFRVRSDATKPEIKQAVELMFGVKVEGVMVSNTAGKEKRFGSTTGWRSGWKKAYVKLAEGHDIDFTAGHV
jgi:large subunit ribosomal protein L23